MQKRVTSGQDINRQENPKLFCNNNKDYRLEPLVCTEVSNHWIDELAKGHNLK